MNILNSFQQFEIPSYKEYDYVIGIDEAGRGALAGPVSVSMVCFGKDFFLQNYVKHHWVGKIQDSKKLTAYQRENLFKEIIKSCIFHKNLLISSKVIDRIGINASIEKAISFFIKYFVLYFFNWEKIKFFIDGNYRFHFKNLSEELMRYGIRDIKILEKGNNIDININKNHNKTHVLSLESIIKGDNLVFSIACSSIISKVKRDNFMKLLSLVYPQYGFEKHKGYGTNLHLQRIHRLGYSNVHRKSYKISKQIKLPFH